MLKLFAYLGKQPRPVLVGVGLGLIVILGGVDYATGAELSFAIVYLLPISLLAWFVGRPAGIVGSALATVAWLLADLLAGHVYQHPAFPYWNALTRFGFFLIVTHILVSLKTSRDRQEELLQFIVHDLRSPLSNVMTGIQLLQATPAGLPSARQQRYLEMCMVSCKRMLVLINALLDTAHLESGQMTLQPRPVAPADLVAAALDQVSLWARDNEVTLRTDLAPTLPEVYADPEMTVRVLINLLSNAIKFSTPGSAVTVRVASQEADHLTFSVRDEGKGLPEALQARAFDKFAQVDLRKASYGSGLGLAFCRLAVEAQHGAISMESAVEEGTTVTFTLPAAAASRRLQTQAAEAARTP